MADQVATNGVVHVISKVMYPLPLKDNVVEVVHNTSSLSTLYKAIMATGVSDIIAGLSLRHRLNLIFFLQLNYLTTSRLIMIAFMTLRHKMTI